MAASIDRDGNARITTMERTTETTNRVAVEVRTFR